LKDRYKALWEIQPDLTRLITEAQNLRGQANELKKSLSPSIDKDLNQWHESLCNGWMNELSRIGMNCESDNHIIGAKYDLSKISSVVLRHIDLIRWLKAASEMLALFGSDIEAAELQVKFPEIKRALLLKKYFEPQIIDELKNFVQPLLNKSGEFSERKLQKETMLTSVSANLTKLRGWSQELNGSYGQEIQRLDNERRSLSADRRANEALDGDYILDLQGQSNDLLFKMETEANRIRVAHLEGLRKIMLLIFQTVGYKKELETALEQLAKQSVQRPHDHRDWFDSLRLTEQQIKNIVYNNYHVDERIQKSLVFIRENIRQLQRTPLSESSLAEMNDIEYQANQFEQQDGLEDLLNILLATERLKERMGELQKTAKVDIEGIDNQQLQLKEQYETLKALAQQSGCPLSNMESAIAELFEPIEKKSLKATLEHIESLQNALTAEQRAFKEWHQAEIARYTLEVKPIETALTSCGVDVCALILPSLSQSDSLDSYVESLNRAKGLQRLFDGKLAESLDELKTQGQAIAQELTQMRPDSLPLSEQAELKELILRFNAHLSEGDTADKFVGLYATVQSARRFLDTLIEEEKKAIQRKKQLIEKLRKFKSDGLGKMIAMSSLLHGNAQASSLMNKVEALAHGAPEKGVAFREIKAQLDQADRLFVKLQTQARRLAARQLLDDIEQLAKKKDSVGDKEFEKNADSLMNELSLYRPEELPPLETRLKIRQLAAD
jgi:hypothetical protein